jgi:DNA-binding beta-propeller fold protein YncE
MKFPSTLSVCALLALISIVPDVPVALGGVGAQGGVVVANRAEGTISVIDTATSSVMNYGLPMGMNTPEPMYVNFYPPTNTVFVGDRANDRVVAFDANTFAVTGMIPTGAGIFHQWGDVGSGRLWVNNDIDNTVTAIDMSTMSVVNTFDTPADLVAMGGKPHDVILDPTGPFGYVSMLGVGGPNDYVVKFSTDTFTEVDRVAVGGDPHLSLSAANNKLYVPQQETGELSSFDRDTLDLISTLPIDNAHGASMTGDGSVFYTTNIAGDGTDALFAIDTATDTVLGMVSTPFGGPHNLALSVDERLIYVTHSGGMSSQVSVIDVSDPTNPIYLSTLAAGLNPFGIATIPEPTTLAIALLGVAGIARRR